MNNPLSKVTVGMYEIHSRFLSTSSKCYKAGNFTDFTISTPNGITFKCNKIIFCHQSTWFYNYFKNNQENEILLPFCDDTTVESFISFFYDGKIVLNQSNVIVYLKYAIFYEVEKLQMIVDLFLGRAVNQTNVLHFVKSMISNGLSKYACKYSQMLADILLKDKDAFKYTVEELTKFAIECGANVIVGPEARGFLFGAPVAFNANMGFVPVRKPHK